MPYPAGHRNRTRERIIRSARTLFNRHGFTEVSIDSVMSHAGLTRGVFYTYFDSKSDLYAEAINLALCEPPASRWPELHVDFTAVDAAQQVINAYLSEQHFEDVEGSCPMVALSSDVARSSPKVKRAFEAVFQGLVRLFESGLRQLKEADRERALAMAGICVGGMVVARSLENRELADSLRQAARHAALELGGWHRVPRKRLANGRRRSRAGG
jgi:TetR/AcrR family transcriptional repressor of nem operon